MTTPAKLQEEIACYEANLAVLVDEHQNKYVLIKGSKIIEYFETERDALNAGYNHFGNDSFLVRPCIESQAPILFTSL